MAATEKTAYQTSFGRVLIAFLPDEDLEKFINRYGLPSSEDWQGCTTPKGFYKAVEKKREERYTIQENNKNVVGIAFSIIKENRSIASLSLYLPIFWFETINKAALIKQLKRYVSDISQKISF